jgi:peptide/nickel transport system permease protein
LTSASAWIYAARRLALAVPLLLGMSVLVFGLMRFVPGDPAVVVLGYKATPEGVRALREAFHLDEPLLRQYLRWLAGAAHGDFGLDFRQNEPIGRMILDRLPVTIELTLLATACAALIGVPLGLLGGGRRGGIADRAALAIGLVGVSIPDFWLGIMLILGVSLGAGLLPSGGFVPLGEAPLENVLHLVLPALTLAVSRAAVLGRLTRAAVLDVVQRGFVQYARAKGLGEGAVLVRHVLPNAAIPIVTVLGLQAGYMLGGAIVVEMIFTLPGVGQLTLDAVLERNYPVVQSTVLVIGALFMLVNLVTDILYGLIDPRLRHR